MICLYADDIIQRSEAGIHEDDIAREFQLEPSAVVRVVDAHRAMQRRKKIREREERISRSHEARGERLLALHADKDPSEQEIAERCKEIQAEWCDRERRYRYYLARSVSETAQLAFRPYTFPTFRRQDCSVA